MGMVYGTDAPRNILYVFVFSLMIGLRHGLHISSPRLDMMFGVNNPMRRFFRYFHSTDLATVHNPILVSL
jgi:hypothetical protein